MMIPRSSVGVEVAGPDLRIAVSRDFAGKRRLLRTDTLSGFQLLNAEDRKRTLSTYVKQKKLPTARVFLTLPASSGLVRDLEFPAEVMGKLRSAVALQIENLSPWPIDEIYWDCSYESPKKGIRNVVAHVAIVPRVALDPWIALFDSAGFALMGASLSSLSWAHGASALWVASTQPTMIFSAESDYVEGALVQNGRLHAITNPGTDAPAQLQSAASQLSRAGRLDSNDNVRVIVYGSNAHSGTEPVRLPFDAAPADSGRLFGAVAASLLGLASSAFRANLIPVQRRHRRNHLQLAPSYALAILLAALAVMFLIREPYQQLAYAGRLDQEVRRLSPEVRSVADQEKQLNLLSDRSKTLDAAVRNRDSNLEALRELAHILPSTTWLNSYQYQDRVITISGYSPGAAALQKVIEDSPVFRDAQFASSITRDASGKDRFTIRATVEAKQ